MRGRLLSRFAPVVPDPGSVVDASVAAQAAIKPAKIGHTREARVMISGDSIFTGGDSAMGDSVTSLRAMVWDHVRRVRGNVRLLGAQAVGLFDNRAAVPAAARPGNARLGDWHSASVGGYTLAQITALAASTEAAQGTADLYVILGGRNDIAARIAAGDSPAQAAAFVLAGIVAYVAARPSTSTVLVCDLTPTAPPYATAATENPAQVLANAGLAAALAGYPNARVVPCGSLLTAAHTDGTSGNHPSFAGLALMAQAVSDAMLRVIGVGGLPFPRAVTPRVAKPRILLSNDYPNAVHGADDGSKGLLPIGVVSFSFGLIYRPRAGDLVPPGYSRALLHLGPDVTVSGVADGSGLWLRANAPVAGDTLASLELYLAGVARFAPNDSLREECTHAIVVAIDQAAHEARVYCVREGRDGAPVTSLVSCVTSVPDFAALAGYLMLGGRNAGGGQYGAKGLFGDVWLANGYVATVDDAEAFYSEGAIPSGVTAYYPCDAGSGGSTAPHAGYTGGTLPSLTINGGWSATAAAREPWHRGFDSEVRGTATLTGTTPVVIKVPGTMAGDEARVSVTRTSIGGTAGHFAAVCGTGTITLTGQAGDTSALAWRFRP